MKATKKIKQEDDFTLLKRYTELTRTKFGYALLLPIIVFVYAILMNFINLIVNLNLISLLVIGFLIFLHINENIIKKCDSEEKIIKVELKRRKLLR